MKSKNLILQVSYTRSLLRISGLTTGDTRSDLVHYCKYQEYKAMCHLPDIHRYTATQQESSRNNNLPTRVVNQLLQSLEGDLSSPSDSSELETRVTSSI